MTNKRRPTDEEMKAKALDRWNNEGGAPASTPRPKRPRDPNQWAKRMVDIATGEVEDRERSEASKPNAKPSKPRKQRKLQRPG